MCCELRAPPTALFTAKDLKPELTWIAPPYKSLAGCNSLPHRVIRAVVSCRLGVLVIHVEVLVNSDSVKFFVIFIVLFFVKELSVVSIQRSACCYLVFVGYCL